MSRARAARRHAPRRPAVPPVRRHRPDARSAALAASRPTPGYDPSHLHRRYDRLTGAWVLVSPTRNVRPSTTTTGDGRAAVPAVPGRARAAGAVRAGGVRQPLPVAVAATPRPVGRRARLGAVVARAVPRRRLHGRPRREPRRAVAAAVRRRRRRVARPDHGAVGRRARLRDGVREPRQRRRRHAPPPPRPDLRLRPRAAGDRHQAGRPRRATGGRTASASGAGWSPTTSAASGSSTTTSTSSPPSRSPPAGRWRCTSRAKATASAGSATSTTTPPSTSCGALSDVVAPLRRPVGVPAALHDVRAGGAAGRCGAGADDWHLHVELLPPHRNPHRLKVRASVETALGVVHQRHPARAGRRRAARHRGRRLGLVRCHGPGGR